jgi:ubiquinone/menaquinone biosynthesis C-methylase UbiE
MLRRSSRTVPAGDQAPNPLLFRIGEFAKAALGCILANGQTIRWATQKRILKAMISGTGPKGLAVDVGCGGGTYAIDLLAPSTARVVAMDISWRHAWITRERVRRQGLDNVLVVVASADALPFKGGIADLVLCSEVLEHVANDAQALRELARVSKPACGRLVVSVPHPPEPVHNPDHVRPGYAESDLRLKLEEAGFAVQAVRFCVFRATRAVIRWCSALRTPLPVLFICQIEQYLSDRGLSFANPCDMVVLAERRPR